MRTELQANILSAGTIRKAMPSCMVYALVQSMTFMVDTILAGHFLGSDAVAAIALGMPIIGLMLSFTGMILQGGFLKMLDSMGRGDMEDYRRVFSVTLTFTLLVDLIFLGICLFGTNGVLGVAGAGKAAAQAVTYGRLYVRTGCLMILFFSLGTVFQLVVATYGYQTDRMISSVICVVVNVVTSVIFLMILPEEIKIAGLGFGSALATLAQTITAFVMMRRRKIQVGYRLYPLNKRNMMDALDMLRRGLPASVDNMLDSVSGSVVNHIVLSAFADGTAVLALVAILKTINSIVRTVGRGTFYATEPLVGILHGGRDVEGIKKSFRTAVKLGVLYAAALAAILILIRTPLLSFYHVGDNADARLGLVLIAVSGVVSVFAFVFNAVYEATGHLSLSLLVAVIPDSVLYPLLIPILSRSFGITGIWLAMGYNFIPFFLVFYLTFVVVGKGAFPVPLERLLALKTPEGRFTALDVSIPTDAESVTFVSEKLQNFFRERYASPKMAYYVALCMEEIAADYLEHRKSDVRSDTKGYMDIKAFRDEGKIEIVLRNYDEPYNPLVFEREEGDFSKIGISMVQKIAQEVIYSYAYHLNVISITIQA